MMIMGVYHILSGLDGNAEQHIYITWYYWIMYWSIYFVGLWHGVYFSILTVALWVLRFTIFTWMWLCDFLDSELMRTVAAAAHTYICNIYIVGSCIFLEF